MIKTRIRHKRDTAANWIAENPILLNGEIAIVDDGNSTKLKIGDGSTAYNSLPFYVSEADLNNATGVIPIANGGTGATTAANARTNLGVSTAFTAASISGKVITLTKADGTTTKLTTQDSVNSFTGAVSQKHKSTFTMTNTTVTKTVSGLTANKPVYYGITNGTSGSGYASCKVTSGATIVAGNGSYNTSCITSAYNNPGVMSVAIPTGTSMTFSIASNDSASKSITLFAYQ